MIITHKVQRNSGATLEPAIYKHGGEAVRLQGLKMMQYTHVFAPVLAVAEHGYTMPVLEQAGLGDIDAGLQKLAQLWSSSACKVTEEVSRGEHHRVQVEPYGSLHTTLRKALQYWWDRTTAIKGMPVGVVHGDPTLENCMAKGAWLDPSVRPMPLEAELDGGKLLQSYFGYDNPSDIARIEVKAFLQRLNLDLCAYYLVTHIVRLYRIQAHARSWALETVINLPERMEKF